MDVYQRRRLVALSAIAVVFVFIVILIGSCGGDDEPTETDPLAGATGVGGVVAQTQATYIDQADAVCLQSNTLIAGIDSADPLDAAAEEATAVESELQQLQTLDPPDEGVEDLQKFLAALQAHSELLNDRVTATEREDDLAIADLEPQIDEGAAKVAKLAGRFGFEICGDPEAVGESTSTGNGEEDTETDTGGTESAVPTETAPPVTETPVTPPVDTGTEGGVGTEPAPTDTGTDDSASGGVSP